MTRAVLSIVTAGLSGVVFGIGLAVARMTDPEKIKDFLDIAAIPQGGWDPSLAIVMLAAIIPAFIGLRAHLVLRAPVAADAFRPQAAPRIDRPLVLGAVLFGLGWGLSGLCPGPAIADLGIVPSSIALFVIAMLAGSWSAGAIYPLRASRQTAAAALAE